MTHAEDEARNQELGPGFPCGWQGPNYLSHYLPPAGSAFSRKLESGAQEWNSVAEIWDAGMLMVS